MKPSYRWTIYIIALGIVCWASLVAPQRPSVRAEGSPLAFKAATEGVYNFNTGALKGQFWAAGKTQGIVSLIKTDQNMELVRAPGLLSYYRLFGKAKRYGDQMRAWPRSARLLPDGAVEITWPPAPDRPIEVSAILRWRAADMLDFETIVKPHEDISDLEVFVSSYFSKGFRSFVYTSPTLHTRGKQPSFLACDANPFVVGSYLAFPRNRRAAAIMYDGRWTFGPNPVHLATGRYFAAPLALKRNEKDGITVVFIARPEECFMILTPYDMEPPDGIAGHQSLYLSLFGHDVKAGETARARARMIVGGALSDADALALYGKFLAE